MRLWRRGGRKDGYPYDLGGRAREREDATRPPNRMAVYRRIKMTRMMPTANAATA